MMETFENQFAEIASLLGDKARAIMLWNLLDGRAYTASEFAVCANISAQSASNHLAKLATANILSVEKQGRHRYYRYANAEVAQVVEAMAALVPSIGDYRKIRKPGQNDFTYARTCYDHFAGKFGVSLTDALVNQNIILPGEKKYEVSEFGTAWFQSIGIETNKIQNHKRSFAHPCLDWSERKHHLAGALGAALLNRFLESDWVRKKQQSREIIITTAGKIELSKKTESGFFVTDMKSARIFSIIF
jgi:DNA-binding transcriptional ArsR family regulator